MGAKGGKGTSFVKFGMMMMISLLIVNIIMMVLLHHHANDTTIILKEFRKISGNSELASTNQHRGHDSRDMSNDDVMILGARNRDNVSRKPFKLVNAEIKRPDEEGESKQIADQNEHLGKQHEGDTLLPKDSKGLPAGLQLKDTNQNKDVVAYSIRRTDKSIDKMIIKLNSSKLEPFFPKSFWYRDVYSLIYSVGKRKRLSGSTLSYVRRRYNSSNSSRENLPNWKKFHMNIRRYALYSPADPAIDGLLHDMAVQKIEFTDDTTGGTELKIIVTFEDGGRAVMKPMRYPRDWPINPNVFVFDDLERHFAEIAAFHLDRLLGFNRVPPVTGRKINVTEFYSVAPKSVQKTYFTSPAGNKCFYGKCDYFCDSGFPFCGDPEILEVSLMAYLPSRTLAPRHSWYQPYKWSYSKWNKAPWETNQRFCDSLKKTYPYNTGKLLLDMIDAHTFDFLNGNPDRHSFAFFKEFGNFSFPILYDNGRGYGQINHDRMSVLAPLRQCCMIRKSTFLKYVKIYTGPETLSAMMEQSLSRDPVSPVLLKGHLTDLDRRLIKILQTVAGCLEKLPASQVIIYDSF